MSMSRAESSAYMLKEIATAVRGEASTPVAAAGTSQWSIDSSASFVYVYFRLIWLAACASSLAAVGVRRKQPVN